MSPRIGDTVHYVSHGSPVRADGTQAFTKECRAAIVTAIPQMLSEGPNTGPAGYTPTVSLCVLNPTGLFFHGECPYDREGIVEDAWGYVGGTWHHLGECEN